MTPAQGSPRDFSTDFLVVGQLGRAHGVKGEIRMSLLTDFPERLQSDLTVYIGEVYKPLRIINCRGLGHSPDQEVLLVTFEGYDDREKVETLRNQMVYVRADDRPPLPDGEYYQHQLLGLRVIDEDGRALGMLNEIMRTGANDVYIIKPETGHEILFPAIDSTILDVDLELREIRVHLLPGLIED